MVPAAVVDKTLDDLIPALESGDAVIDGGNSYYRDDIRRAARLAEHDLDYVDTGTSGGVWGLDRGYCLMIGGPDEAVGRLDPIFASLAPGRRLRLRAPRGATANRRPRSRATSTAGRAARATS